MTDQSLDQEISDMLSPRADGPGEAAAMAPEPAAEASSEALASPDASPSAGLSGKVPQGQAAASVRPALFAPLHPTPGAPDPAAIDLLMDVPLQVTVELGRTRLSVREVLGLGTGSVVELDRFAGEPIDLLVNDRLIARGEVVVIDESFGVRVTEIVRSGQGAAAHRPA
ncbi:MAG: flagellar motor switch protein FliN [Armatimonadetes bacterium]|jgi:flagellar motor switch protein FliN/FliY|nr:flagellar motor switch protein FliN [Armatimonadota bacterium]